ncbi:MAG: hypothetical protein JSW05_07745 [Candidatus Thorarchaeota archaeon]|nr:MAG: hypothetical protein JSW05_07745 [Candidatus Thorarchaeota archaeon]
MVQVNQTLEVNTILEKDTRIPLLGLVFVTLLLSLFFVSEPCVATEVFSEDFDEGLGGFTPIGPVTTIDGCLRATFSGRVVCPCNLTVGTWSFEARDMGLWQDTYQYLLVKFVHDGSYNYRFAIRFQPTDAGKQYSYQLWGPKGRMDSYYGLEGSAAELRGTLHAVNITRTAAGQMSVYLNGSRILSATDMELTSSETVRIVLGYDWAIDNFVVDDTPLEDMSWELLAVGASAVAIVVIVLVVLKRRG